MHDVITRLGQHWVIPLVVINDAADAPSLARALAAGGLPCAEITFRTPAAEASIRAITDAVPEVLVGAGTVLTESQAEVAAKAGAKYIVSPGFDVTVIDWCAAHNMPVIPGVMTPTEIGMAMKKGVEVLKFFPAEAAGGVTVLKAICAPYRSMKFIPTGGIVPTNLLDYLRLPCVHACGGSWLVAEQLIAGHQFDQITALAAEAVALVAKVRK
jgi:2-dehydro-3-deoxyphosphogluconate aldolase / (4S)-4-hydroxy-2-oxoglutarate aldolase